MPSTPNLQQETRPINSFPATFPSGSVVGGPFIQISKAGGKLVDQSAFSSYFGDEELQAEATRVVRTAAMR